jgi:hypothetical protein
MNEKLRKMTPAEFGERMARTILEIGSSSVYFLFQRAVFDIDDFVEWPDVVETCQRISKKRGDA